MKKIIDKKTLEYLADLSRIELRPGKEEKLLKNLEKILEYFEELKEVDTENIESMAGGTFLANIYRQDADLRGPDADLRGKLIKAFPEEKDGFLKVPAVFE